MILSVAIAPWVNVVTTTLLTSDLVGVTWWYASTTKKLLDEAKTSREKNAAEREQDKEESYTNILLKLRYELEMNMKLLDTEGAYAGTGLFALCPTDALHNTAQIENRIPINLMNLIRATQFDIEHFNQAFRKYEQKRESDKFADLVKEPKFKIVHIIQDEAHVKVSDLLVCINLLIDGDHEKADSDAKKYTDGYAKEEKSMAERISEEIKARPARGYTI